MHHVRMPRHLPLVLAGVLALGPLAACGTSQSTSSTPTSTSTASASSSTAAASALTLEDGWVKATSEDMTAAFGTIKNPTDKAVVITGGRSPVAGLVEAHVMTKGENGQMVMEKAKDGFTIPAHGTFDLTPGGPHIMLMEMKKPVRTGEDVAITVTTKDGDSIPLTAVGREFSGAKETYDPKSSGH